MSITLEGMAFLESSHVGYEVGKRVKITAVIEPSGGNLTAVDDGKGAAVTVSVPLTSVTYEDVDGNVIPTNTGSLPSTISVEFGFVQPAFEATGERTISATLADYSTPGTAHTGNAALFAFESYGTVFVADIGSETPADTGVPGTGLLGRYFGNPDLTGQPTFEVVEAPRFEDTEEAQIGVPRIFSARWTGQIKIPETGKFRFKLRVDDGFRLYLDGRLAMDYWADQNETERVTGYYDYTSGQLVKVWIEYFNGSRRGTFQFSWETPSAQFADVPNTVMYSTDGTEALPPVLAPPNQIRFFAEAVTRY